MTKKALITGTTGQDGSYLSELLLKKGYEVYGLHRRGSMPNTQRIDHLSLNKDGPANNFFMTYADLSDSSNLFRVLNKVKPDEIYNLAAQSHVGISFDIPEFTANVNALGPLRLLEAIRNLHLDCKYYQASSSEMFGKALAIPQNEQTPFNPQSPYGVSKVFAFYITKIYRTGYNIFASNGILFNHESPRRGFNFVTRKITLGLARIKFGLQSAILLGNLEAKRDWGHSKDYVEAIWRILQHHQPDDFVIATGETHSIREFVEEVAKIMDFDLEWRGQGKKEIGVDGKTGKTIIKIDENYFRPNEVDFLKGDAKKAREVLNWQPKYTFKSITKLMAEEDLLVAEQEAMIGKRFDITRRKLLIR
jgi:GDPmannose 4,6-dehydratase